MCTAKEETGERPQTARVQQQAPLEALHLYYKKRKATAGSLEVQEEQAGVRVRVGGPRRVWAGGEHKKQEPHTVMWGKSHSTAMSDAHPPPNPPHRTQVIPLQ